MATRLGNHNSLPPIASTARHSLIRLMAVAHHLFIRTTSLACHFIISPPSPAGQFSNQFVTSNFTSQLAYSQGGPFKDTSDITCQT
ncbi:hypothetical protein GOBAR_AA36001 [Gossypium barbadense]|uniref:Uncharacterized protein n=1 Tax=Gossypium barbadense TaxID=3634 RepID=A0A2P5W0U8_GOSBA|nr:hypothetical protein GOBAR_AA36001 [Gossypium barbadense]